MRRFAFIALLALAVSAGYIAWTLWPDGRVDSQVAFDPKVDSPILRELAPGTTLHTVTIIFRRHGPVGPLIPIDTYRPERTRNEVWMTFDATGAVSAYYGEVWGVDDNLLYATASLDGADLVVTDSDGNEREDERIAGFVQSITLESLRASIEEAYDNTIKGLAAAEPRMEALGSETVLVLEDSRTFARPRSPVVSSGGAGGPIAAGGYSIPYVADLDPMEEIRRLYVLSDQYRGVKSEVAIIGADGNETVIESREYVVFEVISGP